MYKLTNKTGEKRKKPKKKNNITKKIAKKIPVYNI